MASSSVLLSAGKDFVLTSSNSSKPLQYLIEVIGLDHGYSKPWSSQQRVPNPRPVKTLFTRDAVVDKELAKGPNKNKTEPEEMFIDVEAVDEVNPSGPYDIKMQYDVSKSKIAMGECERYVSSVYYYICIYIHIYICDINTCNNIIYIYSVLCVY